MLWRSGGGLGRWEHALVALQVISKAAIGNAVGTALGLSALHWEWHLQRHAGAVTAVGTRAISR